MANKVITISGTIASRHVDTDVTEEEFADLFFQFLDEHDYMFGGGWKEEDDDDEQQGGSRVSGDRLCPSEARAIYEANRAKQQK